MKGIKIITYVFGFIGLGMLVGTFFIYKNTKEFLTTSLETKGIVEELIEVSDSEDNSYTYKPLVGFSDIKGDHYTFSSSTSSNPPSYYVNEEVIVLYNPNSPNNAKIKGFISLWGATTILGVIGTLFLGVTVGVLITKIRNKKTQENLKLNGKRIEADFKNVIYNSSYTVNGQSPYQILLQWQDSQTSKVYIFKSNNIWFDPTDFLNTEKIPVFIDKHNPKKYFVDTSFLPEVEN